MSAIVPTGHGALRMAQRAVTLSDAELIAMWGTEVEGGYLVRDRDYQEIERILRSFLTRVRLMRGKRLVLATGRIVTAYHARAKHQRRLLRRARIRNLY